MPWELAHVQPNALQWVKTEYVDAYWLVCLAISILSAVVDPTVGNQHTADSTATEKCVSRPSLWVEAEKPLPLWVWRCSTMPSAWWELDFSGLAWWDGTCCTPVVSFFFVKGGGGLSHLHTHSYTAMYCL